MSVEMSTAQRGVKGEGLPSATAEKAIPAPGLDKYLSFREPLAEGETSETRTFRYFVEVSHRQVSYVCPGSKLTGTAREVSLVALDYAWNEAYLTSGPCIELGVLEKRITTYTNQSGMRLQDCTVTLKVREICECSLRDSIYLKGWSGRKGEVLPKNSFSLSVLPHQDYRAAQRELGSSEQAKKLASQIVGASGQIFGGFQNVRLVERTLNSSAFCVIF